jgi:hypothetical protein
LTKKFWALFRQSPAAGENSWAYFSGKVQQGKILDQNHPDFWIPFLSSFLKKKMGQRNLQ